MPGFFQNVLSSVSIDHRVDQDLRDLGELGRLSVLDTELADLTAIGVIHDRRRGQLAQALHGARVVLRGRDLTGAGDECREAHPESETADQDDGRQPREDTSGVRHGNSPGWHNGPETKQRAVPPG